MILGHLIPAGTPFKPHIQMQLEHRAEPIPVLETLPAEQLDAPPVEEEAASEAEPEAPSLEPLPPLPMASSGPEGVTSP